MCPLATDQGYQNLDSEDTIRTNRAVDLANSLSLDLLQAKAESINIAYENAVAEQANEKPKLTPEFIQGLNLKNPYGGFRPAVAAQGNSYGGWSSASQPASSAVQSSPSVASVPAQPVTPPDPLEGARDEIALSMTRYKKEKNHPLHRMGDLIEDFERYHQKHCIAEPYTDWVSDISYFEALQVLRKIRPRATSWELSHNATAFVKGVQYLSVENRGSYSVEFRDGMIYWKGSPLDTANLETHFSGLGWAMWVQSPDDVFYTNSHVKGRTHHSSFLSGEAVHGAGEWLVKDGRLLMITAKSGHYQPTMPEFYRSLMTLQTQGASLRDTDVVIYTFRGEPFVAPADVAMSDWHNLSQSYVTFGSQTTQKPVRKKQGSFIGTHRR